MMIDYKKRVFIYMNQLSEFRYFETIWYSVTPEQIFKIFRKIDKHNEQINIRSKL